MMEHIDDNGGVTDHAANSREAAGGNKHANKESAKHTAGSDSPSETAAEDHIEKTQ